VKKLLWLAALLIVVFTSGCGIYTTTGSLNPPFSQSKDSTTLYFSGYNRETYFSGYVLWYREEGTISYSVCGYKNQIDVFPTIPEDSDSTWVSFDDRTNDSDNPRIVYEVQVSDLYAQEDLTKSFYEIYEDEGRQFYFAVSAYGINGEESEKIEFGIWP